jgi:TonB family protein
LAAGISGGQQISSSASDPSKDAQSAPVKVYGAGSVATAPELLPPSLTPFPTEKCKKKVDGKVVLSVTVDAAGQPRNLMFIHPLGTDLDRFALRIVAADRFKPGTRNGIPIAVVESVEVSLQTCPEQTEDNSGKEAYTLRLRSQPAQKFGNLPQPSVDAVLTSWSNLQGDTSSRTSPTNHVGGAVTAPVPLTSPAATYTPEARKAKINGKCLIALIVDEQGMPQNVQVERSLDPGLDQNAMDAVNRYRFKPAMRSGEPVPVRITVEVKFEIW